MDLYDLLRAVRRYAWLIAALVVFGVGVGVVTAPDGDDGETRTFRATHVLIVNPASERAVNLAQAALFTTTGEVPGRAAEILGEPATEGFTLARRISTEHRNETSSLSITARSTSATRAEQLADAFAQALVERQADDASAAFEERRAEVVERVDELEARIDELFERVAADPTDTALQAEVTGVSVQLADAAEALSELEEAGPAEPPLTTLQAARATDASSDGFSTPDSPVARGAILGLLGLVLGMAAAAVLARLDVKIRDVEAAEAAFGHPVVVEIPVADRSRHALVRSATEPGSPVVEAYRVLRASLVLEAEHRGEPPPTAAPDPLPVPVEPGSWRARLARRAVEVAAGGAPAPEPTPVDEPDETRGAVVAVVSPGPSEGKTTTVAHLAAALAEVGRRVLVMSADFRRPRLHELFEVEREPGLVDVVEGRARLDDVVASTPIERVWFLPSGAPVTNPSALMEPTAELAHELAAGYDYVLIDTAPLLVAADSTDLVEVADQVLVVARADHTARQAAARAAALIERIDRPVLGVVLTAVPRSGFGHRGYRYGYGYGYEPDLPDDPDG